VAFHCPGCNELHVIHVGEGPRPKWSWNGNAERPTFKPSILVRGIRDDLYEDDWEEYENQLALGGSERVLSNPKFRTVCHSFVTDGLIRFLNDCTHTLKGQTVPLPDLPGCEGG